MRMLGGRQVSAPRLIVILLVGYAGLVVAFESMLGYFQPGAGTSLVIATIEADGTTHDRVVQRLDSDDRLYVSANHWPRAWYHRALANPNVQVTMDGEKADYLAVPASEEEIERVDVLPIAMRVLTGFPPKGFLRLDPR